VFWFRLSPFAQSHLKYVAEEAQKRLLLLCPDAEKLVPERRGNPMERTIFQCSLCLYVQLLKRLAVVFVDTVQKILLATEYLLLFPLLKGMVDIEHTGQILEMIVHFKTR
jgi:hypothetical protein